MFNTIFQNIAKGMVARRLIGGGGDNAASKISSKDYLSELVAEKISLDEYMRTTKVSGKSKTPSYASKATSPEGGIMAYRRQVQKMVS